MLSKEEQKRLLKLLKVSEEDIAKIVDVDTEEVAVLADGLKVYNTEEFTQLEANLKTSGKTGYINAGKEIAIKEMKDKLGLEYDGKDPVVFLEKAQAKIIADAKIEPSKAKEQWEAEKRTLQEKVDEWKGKAEQEAKDKAIITRDTDWLKKFPAKRSDAMPDEDRLLLTKNKLTVIEEDGKVAYSYKGKRLQDDKANDFDLEAAITHVFTEEKWLSDGTTTTKVVGRGDHSQRSINTGKPMNLKEAEDQWVASGKKASGADFQAHVLALKKENKDFDLNPVIEEPTTV